MEAEVKEVDSSLNEAWFVIEKLPVKIMTLVFRFLDIQSLSRVEGVSRVWYRLVDKYRSHMPHRHVHHVHVDRAVYDIDRVNVRLIWTSVSPLNRRRRIPSLSWDGDQGNDVAAERIKSKTFAEVNPLNISCFMSRHFFVEKLTFWNLSSSRLNSVVCALKRTFVHVTEVAFLSCDFTKVTPVALSAFLLIRAGTLSSLSICGCIGLEKCVCDELFQFTGEFHTLNISPASNQERLSISDVTLKRLGKQERCFRELTLSNCKIKADGVFELLQSWLSRPDESRMDQTIHLMNVPLGLRSVSTLCEEEVQFVKETSDRLQVFDKMGNSWDVYRTDDNHYYPLILDDD